MFLFHPRMHEPGSHRVIGKDYRDTGVTQGQAVLADLARHPATAAHIATKLARHFIADDPPPTLVETLTKTFLETDGDLWKVSQALVMAPEARSPQQAKYKRPSEWLTSYFRAEGSIDCISNQLEVHQRQSNCARPFACRRRRNQESARRGARVARPP
jgi:uncharacterized protein (DUF1800 family)